ncbi:CaiF/GrlA family transcriptional regulator [Serratia marcescens]|nr:CaiF/GrlA family transcriptional regulator [Serratia marcescens]MBH2766646.1 CaiF/GrlA family transcriptional regulator [Serratia marcescens]MBH2766706.1 CaiF/GrlA family transcriptional regulator [Serratia marcescens]
MNGKQTQRRGQRIPPSQSNYGGYELPDFLAEDATNPPPLYLAVAQWGWMLGRPFSRDEVAQTFRITPLRAGDVMSYLVRRARVPIWCQVSYEPAPSGRRRLVQVLEPPAERASVEKVKVRPDRKAAPAASRRRKGSSTVHQWILRSVFCPRSEE